MEEKAPNIDRLITVHAGRLGRHDKWIIPASCENASK